MKYLRPIVLFILSNVISSAVIRYGCICFKQPRTLTYRSDHCTNASETRPAERGCYAAVNTKLTNMIWISLSQSDDFYDLYTVNSSLDKIVNASYCNIKFIPYRPCITDASLTDMQTYSGNATGLLSKINCDGSIDIIQAAHTQFAVKIWNSTHLFARANYEFELVSNSNINIGDRFELDSTIKITYKSCKVIISFIEFTEDSSSVALCNLCKTLLLSNCFQCDGITCWICSNFGSKICATACVERYLPRYSHFDSIDNENDDRLSTEYCIPPPPPTSAP